MQKPALLTLLDQCADKEKDMDIIQRCFRSNIPTNGTTKVRFS